MRYLIKYEEDLFDSQLSIMSGKVDLETVNLDAGMGSITDNILLLIVCITITLIIIYYCYQDILLLLGHYYYH